MRARVPAQDAKRHHLDRQWTWRRSWKLEQRKNRAVGSASDRADLRGWALDVLPSFVVLRCGLLPDRKAAWRRSWKLEQRKNRAVGSASDRADLRGWALDVLPSFVVLRCGLLPGGAETSGKR